MSAADGEVHTTLDSTFPVFVPECSALRLSKTDFDDYVRLTVKSTIHSEPREDAASKDVISFIPPKDVIVAPETTSGNENKAPVTDQPFMKALHDATVKDLVRCLQDGEMLTENADIAYARTTPLVDLFLEFEEVISGERLQEVLTDAWQADPLATLKIIFNSRSIHLGKANRHTTYRALGWLATNHPVTLLTNLKWLVSPVIDSTVKETGKDDDGDFVMMEAHSKGNDGEVIVANGMSHGYWKDLLNILALAVKGELTVLGDPRKVLNVHDDSKKRDREWSTYLAAVKREQKKKLLNTHATNRFNDDGFYRALHLSVSRLFADQLQQDKKLLESGTEKDARNLSLAAKWAPSLKGFHDKNTFIVSTIAEIMFPQDQILPHEKDRTVYLKYAREHYRARVISPLRKALEIVERDITATTFGNINYERVPSQAMSTYSRMFATKDFDRFDKYIEAVAAGKQRISGATLLPSTLVVKARKVTSPGTIPRSTNPKVMIDQKMQEIENKTLDGQWNTLVQRIRNSGKLEASMAICDVSGSMLSPKFPDGSCPLDSSIGLSLLLAEVTAPPFGGALITFSKQPTVVRVGGEDDPRNLIEKVAAIDRVDWNQNTDFVAVFERLLLPMAIENNIKPSEMVKQLFVFSDMQFDQACTGGERSYKNSFERIKKKFNDAGYELPRLIFWNLAGGRSGYAAAKPTGGDEANVSLVSGYSQGSMKMFLENGQFESEEEGEVFEEGEIEDDFTVVAQSTQKSDPLATVKKAISHPAYRMLVVVD